MTSPVRGSTVDSYNNEKYGRRLTIDQDGNDRRESREEVSRLTDDLQLLRAEQLVSHQEQEDAHRSRSQRRRHAEPIPEDAFNQPVEVQPGVQGSGGPGGLHPQHKPTAANKFWGKIKKFPRVLRYVVYMAPVAIILLTPILIDKYAVPGENLPVGGPGGVKLHWFGIWLEIVWCSLWGSRIICAIMPTLFGLCAKLVGSSNHKKWKDIGAGLELSTALFLWGLAVLASYLPTLNNHRDNHSGEWDGDNPPYIQWIDYVYKVIIGLFVLFALNIAEKILIQWIASSFHVRTYAYRIEENKRDIQFLVQLFEHARQQTYHNSSSWSLDEGARLSGAKTPLKAIQANARQAWSRFGTVANRMAGDFTGRKVMDKDHPRKVVLELLRTTPTSHTLARMIFRAHVSEGRDTLILEDFQKAFPGADEDAEACFGVFDRDLNGDISMEELELVCNEIHLEKKAIAASLKDLDSVIKKLDSVFLFVIAVISIIVLVSILSGSAAAALGSAGTTVLGLAWMLQATAQEFLQSMIFVFIKHPFDVGDRVRVYGNTGAMMQGDDYYVQEISLLYTEFKKMEGHVVQAPNSLLNNLFILNQRRSNGLADPIELVVRFGTRNEVIEELKARMLDFIMEHKRDYIPRILSEVKTIDEVYSVTINFIFFHKSNFQNELLRLQRHNKFAAELMRQMVELGIEGPRKHQPGGNRDQPFFWSSIPPPPAYTGTTGPAPAGPDPIPEHNQPSGPSGVAGGSSSGHANGIRPLDTNVNIIPFTPSPTSMHNPSSAFPFPAPPTSASAPPAAAAAPMHPGRAPSASSTGTSAAAAIHNTYQPSAELRRRRAESRAAAQAAMDAVPDFGDVYESRRRPGMGRLQSVRVPPPLQRQQSQLSQVQSHSQHPGDEDHPGSPHMERVQSRASATSRGHRFFGRTRTGTIQQAHHHHHNPTPAEEAAAISAAFPPAGPSGGPSAAERMV